MRTLSITLLVFYFGCANAEQYKIPWKGDYSHNSCKTWSRDNPTTPGLSCARMLIRASWKTKTRVIKGWEDHYWHLSYNPAAENDMMQTIISALKTREIPQRCRIQMIAKHIGQIAASFCGGGPLSNHLVPASDGKCDFGHIQAALLVVAIDLSLVAGVRSE